MRTPPGPWRCCTEGVDIHFLLHGALMPILAELAFTCRDLLGWSDQETCELLVRPVDDLHRARPPAGRAGRPGRGSARGATVCCEPSDGGARPAGRVGPGVRRGLRRLPAGVRLPGAPLRDRRPVAWPRRRSSPCGCSPTSSPTATIRAPTRRRSGGRRAAAVAGPGRPSPGGRPRERRALRTGPGAAPSGPIRCARTTSSSPSASRLRCCDTASLEIGRRLADRGQLDRRDDVFFLTLDEARAALRRRRRPGERLVSRRRGERAFVEQHPGPATYGKDPGPPPSLDALPAEARFTMTAPAVVHRPGLRGSTVQPGPAGGRSGPRRDRGLARPATPGRSGSSWTNPSSASCGRVTCWSARSPRRCGRCCSPASGRWSPTPAGCCPTRRSSPASMRCRPWSPPATRPPCSVTARSVTVDGGAGRIEVQP